MGNHAKLNYIHIFRALAIIIIVAGHCVDSTQEILADFFNVFLKGGTALFVFIAGFLFQYLSDNFSYPIYQKKKFFNVVLPYLLTSVIGITAIFLSSTPGPFADLNKTVQVFMFLTTGFVHNFPTWYIPMTCILFLSAPVLLKLENKIIFNKYSLLFFVLPFFICLSCFVPRYELSFFVTKDMSAWQAYFGYLEKILFDTVLLFPIYILGMFFAKYKDTVIKKIYQKRVFVWTIFVIGCVLQFLLLYYNFLPSRLLFVNVVLILLILGYLRHYDEKIASHSHINNLFGIVADYSFSIFFLHFYFVMRFNKLFENLFHWNNAYLSAENFHLGYWICYSGTKFIVAFFGSFLLAVIIKKLLEKAGVKHTRYFIGA